MKEMKLSDESAKFVDFLRNPNTNLYYTLGIENIVNHLIEEAVDYVKTNPEETFDILDMLSLANEIKHIIKELSKSE